MARSLRRLCVAFAAAAVLGALMGGSALGAPAAARDQRVSRSTSTNWSGYAVQTDLTSPQTGVVTDVKGTWQVPFVTSSNNAWSSAWVGIDGYSSPSVEQIGTDQDTSKRSTRYYGWYEMYPNAAVLIPGFTVGPGNIITAEVRYIGSNQYVLSMTNSSTGMSFQTTQTAAAQRSSAEWIMEAPSSGTVLPLANFGTIRFSDCSAQIAGTSGPISAWPYDPLTMVTGGRKSAVKAAPSLLTSGGDGFSVTWYHK